jgi:hypothetical protein
MSIINIMSNKLIIKEYNNQRIITFKDIDMIHQRSDGTAKRNFNTNQKHFIKGEDYYEIGRNEISTDLWENFGFSKYAPRGYLITESGYLMIVKSFNDNLSWKVQRELIKTYFSRKKLLSKMEDLPPLLKHLINTEFKIKEIENKQNKLIKNVQQLNSIISVNNNTSLRQQFNKSIRSLAYQFEKPISDMYSEIYKIINTNKHINIKARATHRNIRPIDVLENDGLLEYALRIVNNLFQKIA